MSQLSSSDDLPRAHTANAESRESVQSLHARMMYKLPDLPLGLIFLRARSLGRRNAGKVSFHCTLIRPFPCCVSRPKCERLLMAAVNGAESTSLKRRKDVSTAVQS